MNNEGIVMTAFFLLIMLLIVVLIWWKAMFSKQRKEVEYAKALFIIVSLYIWFRFVKVSSISIVLEFINNSSSIYSSKLELVAFIAGVLIMLILDVVVASSVILELGIIFITSQIIFTYIYLIFFHELLKSNIEYNALYVFSSLIIGLIVYLISKFIFIDKKNDYHR